MSNSNLNLPQPLLGLAERVLPQKCREEIARMVGLGYRREHMMIAADFSVHIDPELAMLYTFDADEEIGDASRKEIGDASRKLL